MPAWPPQIQRGHGGYVPADLQVTRDQKQRAPRVIATPWSWQKP